MSIPLHARCAIVGVSGSGKSSLAFDTIAREGLRRFLESATWSDARGAAARRLAEIRRPRVRSLTNLPAVLAVGEGDARVGPWTSLASLSGAAPALRALIAGAGVLHCPRCGSVAERAGAARQADALIASREGVSVRVLAEIAPREVWEQVFLELPARGVAYAYADLVDGSVELRTDEAWALPRGCQRLFAQTDRLLLRANARDRLIEAIERAVDLGRGRWWLDAEGVREARASARLCAVCGEVLPTVSAGLLHRGAAAARCSACRGAAEACLTCEGSGWSALARSLRLAGRSIADFESLDAFALRTVVATLDPGPRAALQDAKGELLSRLDCLIELGLGASPIGRRANTLSTGELQRARAAAALGARLRGALFVLDEPAVGCHPIDRERLLRRLDRVRDEGNTILVVEHDREIVRTSDWIVEMGPGAGAKGGRVVAIGSPADLRTHPHSSFAAVYDAPPARFTGRPPDPRQGSWIELRGCRGHNLRGVSVRFPMGSLTVVCGPSGSGKSSLVFGTLAGAARRLLTGESTAMERVLPHEGIDGLEGFDRRLVVGPRLPARSVRSTPASYLGAAAVLRELLASTPAARARGFEASHFSANRAGWRRRDAEDGGRGGRCEACAGRGFHELDLDLLEAATFDCRVCQGTRFAASTLEVRWRGRNVAEWYALTIEEAAAELASVPKIAAALEPARALGLGYVRFGERGDRLSGGEWKRLQLAKELGRSATAGRALVLLDEPTRGLDPRDVDRLLTALRALTAAQHTVIVVEHSLDVVRASDWSIELGPGAGSDGGRVVFEGAPRALARAETPTGEALRGAGAARAKQRQSSIAGAKEPPAIQVRGAHARNLKGFDVAFRAAQMTCVTGPSGSGKSALVCDVVGAEGRRRFLSALSISERRAVESLDIGGADSVEGLGATLVLTEAKGASLGDVMGWTRLLAELYAAFGEPRCPACAIPLTQSEPSEVADRLLASAAGGSLRVLAPLPEGEAAAPALRARGFARVWTDLGERRLEDVKGAEWKSARLVVDRLKLEPRERPRLLEALEEAAWLGAGRGEAQVDHGDGAPERITFDRRGGCSRCGRRPERGLTTADFLREPLTEYAAAARWRDLPWPGPPGFTLGGISQLLARGRGAARAEEPEQALLAAIARRLDVASALLGENRPLTLASSQVQARAAWMLGAAMLAPVDSTLVLDDPTRGLARADAATVAAGLDRATQEGKTVVVATCDPLLLASCAQIVRLGPGAGARGGSLVAIEPPISMDTQETPAPAAARVPRGWILDPRDPADIEKGELESLVRAADPTMRTPIVVGFGKEAAGTPCEVLGLLDPLTQLFGRLPRARELGFEAARFRFDLEAGGSGRCPTCRGLGVVALEADLLAGETVPCGECHGARFEPQTLSVKLYGKSMAEVLDLDLGSAFEFFGDHPRLRAPLGAAIALGLGHVQLGAPAARLGPSDGARLALSRELERDPARTAWCVGRAADGLFGEDLTRLARVLDGLVKRGGIVLMAGARAAEELPALLEALRRKAPAPQRRRAKA